MGNPLERAKRRVSSDISCREGSSHVEAGISYGYKVVEDAKLLIVFDRVPGIDVLSAL